MIPKKARSLRRHCPAPPQPSQDKLRVRRRQRLRVTYGKSFDLAAEVGAIAGPLAARVAGLPSPGAARGQVRALVVATHHVVSVIAVWVDGQRPAPVPVDDEDLAGGGWAALLVMMARPYTAGLSELLRRAYPPSAEILRGQSSRSERLTELLRVVDDAALTLARYCDRQDQGRRGAVEAREGKAS